MAKTAARPVRGFVALCLVAASVCVIAPTFVSLGGSLRAAPRTSRVTAYGTDLRVPMPSISAVEAMTPLPWAEDLEGSVAVQEQHNKDNTQVVDDIIEHIMQVEQGLQDDGITEAQLYQYDRILSSGIQGLEDQIETMKADLVRDSMEVKSEAQLRWLEYMLQSVQDLQEQLQRVQSARGLVNARIQRENRGFFGNMLHAVACAFGGHKVVSNSDYPASGVSSYTGEPARMN